MTTAQSEKIVTLSLYDMQYRYSIFKSKTAGAERKLFSGSTPILIGLVWFGLDWFDIDWIGMVWCYLLKHARA